VLTIYTLVALWVTRPLLWQFTDHSLVAFRETKYDIPLNAYVLSWGVHALVTRPLHFFDANIYHPAPHALAYTEHMLGSLPFFAPVFLATGNPAIALNVLILADLVLSAAGAFLVVWRWTGSWPGALLAGLLLGFYPRHVRALAPNLQALQYFPLILLFLDRVLAGGGWGATAGLAASLLGQCTASYYYAYPAVLATIAAALTCWLTRQTRRPAAALAAVGLATGVTGLILGGLSLPYFRVAAGGYRTLYQSWTERMPTTPLRLLTDSRSVLGTTAVLLAVVAIAVGLRRGTEAATRRRLLIAVVWIVVGLVLYTGPGLVVNERVIPMPSPVLAGYAPGFAALRARGRLFVLVPVSLSVLAGMGIAALAAFAPAGRTRGLVAAGLAAVALFATCLKTNLSPCDLLELPSDEQVPPVYRALAAGGPGPVLELPVGATDADLAAVNAQTWYEYFSIFHWRPLLNGYASYWPLQFEVVMAMARALPERRALENLVACTGVRWIVVHRPLMYRDRAWDSPVPGLQLVGRFGSDLLCRVSLPPGGRCGAGLYHTGRDVTLEGTPRLALPVSEQRATIEAVRIPSVLKSSRWRAALLANVRLRNDGNTVWPAVGVDGEDLVHLSYRWLDRGGRPLVARSALISGLPVDLRPGETIDVPLAFWLPLAPGDYLLEVVVEQGGVRFETAGGAQAAVRVVAPG